jgi:hypothetical protein
MATTATPKIVGKALYLELIADPSLDSEKARSILGWYGDKATKQIIVFPQYQDDTGKVFEAVVMSRTISEYSPRAQWDSTYLDRALAKAKDLESTNHMGYTDYPNYSRTEWDSVTEREKYEARKRSLELILRRELLGTTYEGEGDERKSVAKQGWVVRDDKPFSVEVTDQDLLELHRDWKTPQAVIRRINKVRDSLDKFPKKLA